MRVCFPILKLPRKPEVVHRRCRHHHRLALPIDQIRDDAVNGGGPAEGFHPRTPGEYARVIGEALTAAEMIVVEVMIG